MTAFNSSQREGKQISYNVTWILKGTFVRDIIVIGASAGGIKALENLFGALRPDMQASIFVVVHTPPTRSSNLPEILTRFDHLTAVHPRDNQVFEQSAVYVAPPGNHMVLEDDHIRVNHGPLENRARPAI